MAVLVALGAMSLAWMAVVAVVVARPEAAAAARRGRRAAGAGDRRPRRRRRRDLDRHEGEKDMTNHTIGTREEWLAARLELLDAEKELTRRSDEVARQRRRASLGPRRQGLPVRDRGRQRVAGGPLRRPLAAPDVPLHVRARVHGRLPGLLGDRGRLQRLGRPPGAPRRRDDRRVARADRRDPGATSAAWGGRSRGRPRSGSDFNYDFNVSFTEEQQRAGASTTTTARWT